MKLHTTYLIGSIIALVISFLDIGAAPQWFLAGPIGALLFGMFLIFRVLDKETILFDEEENRSNAPLCDKPRPTASRHSDVLTDIEQRADFSSLNKA